MLELFLDDQRISWQQNATRYLVPPEKHAGSPIVRSEHPWEKQFVTVYGSVLPRDGGGFRMWYMAGAKSMRSDQCLCYAESDDGLSWQRVMSDANPYHGTTPTNILLGPDPNVHGPCVIRNEHDDDPERRYLLLFDSYWFYRPDMPELGDMRWCYSATSPDGIRWTPPRGRPAIPGKSDVGQSVVWDPAQRRYIAYLRGGRSLHDPFNSLHGESKHIRYVRAAVSSDFEQWSAPIELLRADEQDGYPDHQFHQLSVTRRGDQYIGLLSLFHVTGYREVQKEDASKTTVDPRIAVSLWELGTCDTQLITSRDGLHWSRVCDRRVYLPLGQPGQWDAYWLVTASQIVFDGDRMLLYYAACDRPRGDSGKYEIGVATGRRDRFQGIRPRDMSYPAIVETKPLTLEDAGDLTLNATPHSTRSRIVAELCNFEGHTIEGFASADCDPITTDGLDHVVRWRGRPITAAQGPPVYGRALRVRLYLYDASLFAAEFPSRDPWA